MKDRVSKWHYLLAAIALAGMLSMGAMTLPSRGKRRVGRLTAAEAAARSELVCRACAPSTAPMTFITETRELWKGRKHVGDVWCVDCAEAKGKDLAYMVWGAQTGELLFVSVLRHRDVGRVPLPRPVALHEAAHWLRRLGLAKTGERWRMQGEAQEGQTVWQMTCRTNNRKAVTTIDRSSGDLVTAMTVPANGATIY